MERITRALHSECEAALEEANARIADLEGELRRRQTLDAVRENFWRCRHGFHSMDRATRVPILLTPGYRGQCKRCGVDLHRSLI